jgi:hypothetical protein
MIQCGSYRSLWAHATASYPADDLCRRTRELLNVWSARKAGPSATAIRLLALNLTLSLPLHHVSILVEPNPVWNPDTDFLDIVADLSSLKRRYITLSRSKP